ncbi:hypothetical protein DIPPA_20000 [Diplonema papillatum]|nr:hypothetical protein DIPPA_20000 [Diplonema papillatum]
MPIKYAAVFFGSQRVAEYPSTFPSHSELCQKLANKEARINKYNRSKLTDDAHGVDVSYLATGRDVLVCCVSTQDVAMRISFDMLARIEQKTRGDRQDWPSPKETLKKEMEFSNDPRNDAAKLVQNQISEIQDIMMDNVDKMLDRQDKIENMVQKTDALANEGQTFFKRGRDIRRKMCCQQAKMTIMVAVIVLVVIFIIILFACNPNFSRCS